MPSVVHWKNRLRAWRKLRGHTLCIKIERIDAYIGEDRRGPLVEKTVGRSGKCYRCGDRFVPGL